MALPEPKLDEAAAALVAEGARFVVTPLLDEHLLGQTHLRTITRAGIIDVMRGGLPPLDFDTVAGEAMAAQYDDVEFLIAGLRSIVGFKRLAGRPRDRNDLLGLGEIHGELPNDPIPGLDS